jgi:malonate-semialdehyde dehydrogenase (acetylating) / methylmalonate-semialdehyde dehydrogenase
MPDADLTMTIPALLGSAFGNAGERCLAGSVAVAVGDATQMLLDPLCAQTRKLVVGPGDQAGVDVGPLIRAEHRDRVAHYVEQGVAEGATLLVDGRTHMQRKGFFLGPTILNDVTPAMTVGREELFGPVLSVAQAQTLEEAIAHANHMALGNMAVIFTRDGRAARMFREGVEAGMVGVNVPVAQPFAFFPFSGWKGSFYGDLHVHGTDGIEFYTRKKMFITRW